MDTAPRVDISKLIDEEKVTLLRFRAFLFCGASLLLAGWEMSRMGSVAGRLANELVLPRSTIEAALTVTRYGVILGSVLFAMLADRVGRRSALIGGTVLLSATTLLTAFALDSWGALLGLRFLCGIGIGAVVPVATTLIVEYSPRDKQIANAMVITLAFSAGALVGANALSWLASFTSVEFGFFLGGLFALVIAFLLILRLPESIVYLVVRGRTDEVDRWLKRAGVSEYSGTPTPYTVSERWQRCAPVGQLFVEGRTSMTWLYWAVNLTNGVSLYFFQSVLFVMIARTGNAVPTSPLVNPTTCALLATAALAYLSTRVGVTRVLIFALAAAAVGVASIGSEALWSRLLLPTVVVYVIAAGVVGGQQGLNALVATRYPTFMRATAVGLGVAIARIGTAVGSHMPTSLSTSGERLWPFALAAAISVAIALKLHGFIRQRDQTAAPEAFGEQHVMDVLPVGAKVRLHKAVRTHRDGVIKDVKPGQYHVTLPDSSDAWVDWRTVVAATDVRIVMAARWMGFLTFVLGGGWWGLLAAYLAANPLEQAPQELLVSLAAGTCVVLLFPTMVITAVVRCRRPRSAWRNDAAVVIVFAAMLVALALSLPR